MPDFVMRQTMGEEIANAVSHGLGTVLAVAGTTVLIVKASFSSHPLPLVSVVLYGASLIVLYLFSTLYHAMKMGNAKEVLRIFDHCSIFLLILGSYIPISLCMIAGPRGWILFGVNTACAVVGIVLNAVAMDRWQRISMILYVVMGWSVVSSLNVLIRITPPWGMALLVGGGIFYTLGIIFFKNKKKYMHFVWHIFVLLGSVTHYFFILNFCL